jgi:hypothetical protein
LQGGRNRKWGQRAAQNVTAIVLAQEAALEHRLGQLLDEQRYAIRVRDDLIHQLGRKGLAARDLFHQGCVLSSPKAVQRQRGHVRLPDPGWYELRPKGDHEQDRQVLRSCNEQIEQLA